jgi:hypothetical protein
MPEDPIEGTKHFARFTLPNGKAVDGEFLLDGPNTRVVLYMDKHPSPSFEDFASMHADVLARGCLSFLKCLVLTVETTTSSDRERQTYRVHLHPHFVHAWRACLFARYGNQSAGRSGR